MRYFLLLLLLAFGNNVAWAAKHPCSTDSLTQAKKLLSFHVEMGDIDERIALEDPFVASSMRNPKFTKQRFDVLEVIGYIKPHGEYRMRFIYMRMPNGCLLMGQEILEHAKL
jgi:hypothetical protein